MDIIELSQSDSDLKTKLRCPFCRKGLNDSGGCEHVLYTHTTMDGFLEGSLLFESVVNELRSTKLEELTVDDPDLSEEDVELDPEEIMDAIAARLATMKKKAILFQVSAVFGSTASYLVSE